MNLSILVKFFKINVSLHFCTHFDHEQDSKSHYVEFISLVPDLLNNIVHMHMFLQQPLSLHSLANTFPVTLLSP